MSNAIGLHTSGDLFQTKETFFPVCDQLTTTTKFKKRRYLKTLCSFDNTCAFIEVETNWNAFKKNKYQVEKKQSQLNFKLLVKGGCKCSTIGLHSAWVSINVQNLCHTIVDPRGTVHFTSMCITYTSTEFFCPMTSMTSSKTRDWRSGCCPSA